MANYKSNYTGSEIDSAVNKANSIPIIPQPTSENVGKVLGVVEGAGRDADPQYGLVPMSGGGHDGADGFSPAASVSKVGTTATITITDKNGTTTATVSDGAKGEKGDTGDKGDTGAAGADGQDGASAYEIAVAHGFSGTEAEWLASLKNAYRTASIPFGVVDNTSTATVFTATVQGITELRDGVCAYIRNGKVTSAEGCTLNVNNLGAKPIYSTVSAATAVTTTFNINYTMLFIYNSTRVSGGCWDMYYGYDANTTYTPVKLGFGYATCSTAAATAAKTAALSSYTLNTGGIVAVKFTNAVPANATLNINSKGAKAIYYKGAAITDGVIKAGDTVAFIYSTYYHIISIDRQPVVDSTPTAGSDNLVTSDGVASALLTKIGTNDPAQYVNLSSNGLTDGAAVTCSTSPLTVLTLFSTQPKVFFILNSLILFTPSYADANTGTVKMYCAYDTGTEINEYYITLQPASASSMAGTLTVIGDGDSTGY